jgi:hypothetical protein
MLWGVYDCKQRAYPMKSLRKIVGFLTLTAMAASPLHQLAAEVSVQVPGEHNRAPGEYGRSPGDYAHSKSEYMRTPGEYGRSPGDYSPVDKKSPSLGFGHGVQTSNYGSSPENSNAGTPTPPNGYNAYNNNPHELNEIPCDEQSNFQYSNPEGLDPYAAEQYMQGQGQGECVPFPQEAPGAYDPYNQGPNECFGGDSNAGNPNGNGNANVDPRYAQPKPQYVSTTGGCGYNECRQIPYLLPLIVFSAVALTVIIVVALSKSSGHSSHD